MSSTYETMGDLRRKIQNDATLMSDMYIAIQDLMSAAAGDLEEDDIQLAREYGAQVSQQYRQVSSKKLVS